MELKLGIYNSEVSVEEKNRILAEQTHTCQFCGFKSASFQEAINIDGEILTVCSFCKQTLNLFSCAERRAGYLIYLPEMSQIELNHILRAIYVARSDSNPEIANKARKAFDELSARRALASSVLGSDEPKVLANIMASFMSDEEIASMSKKLSGIRLFSLDKKIELEDGMEFNEFPQMLNFWKSNVDFLNSPCSNWEKIESEVKIEEKNSKKIEEEASKEESKIILEKKSEKIEEVDKTSIEESKEEING